MRVPAQLTRPERTRAVILDGALRTFLRSGFEGTSVDTVAQVAGVAKSTLYAHFASKDDLFAALLHDRVCEFSASLEFALAGKTAFADALVAVALAFLRMLNEPQRGDFMRLIIAESARYPALANLFYEAGPRRTRDTIATLLATAPASAGCRFDDPARCAEDLLGILSGHGQLRAVLGLPPESWDRDLPARAERAVAGFLRMHAA
jgi:TetR/AcrR family transcriptional repressor of mexJK operon